MTVINLDRKTIAELPEGEGLWWDTTLKGFGLLARRDAGGMIRRSFLIQFRIDNKQRKIKLGDAAKINADQARKKAEKLFAQITLGIDPAAEKKAERAASATTLRAVIDQYLEMKEHAVQGGNHRASSLKVTRLYLTGDYFKPLHSTGINAVTRAAIATRLNHVIVNNGAPTASRSRAHLSAFFTWAMQQGIAEANPVIGTAKPAASPASGRVLSNDELARIWRACKDDDYGRIVRLLILTGCRRQEIGSLCWSWIDLDQGTMTIPGTHTKNYCELVLPLTAMMREIIGSVPHMVDRDPLFGIRAEGFTSWQRNPLDHGIKKPWRVHDLRRSVATGMADLGIQPHIIEAVLNHVSGHKAGVAGIYNKAAYVREMRNALAVWSEHVASIVTGDERKVVPGPGYKQPA
jgi:integrase